MPNSSTQAGSQVRIRLPWRWRITSNSCEGVQSSAYIAGKSDIAAAYDGISTDYIFYESSDNKLVRALYYGKSISDVQNLAMLASGSKLAASYDGSASIDGATVFFQAEGNSTEIQYKTIDRSGNVLQEAVVG